MADAPRNIAPTPAVPESFRRVHAIDGHYINDHCLIAVEGRMHLFYILGQVGKGCYTPGNEVIIGHSVSTDLATWTVQSHALVADPRRAHESGHVFAPCVVEVPVSTNRAGSRPVGPGGSPLPGGRFWMFYSSDNQAGAQFINLAVSDDLYTWVRHPANPILTPPDWAVWDPTIPCSCRDPHVIRHPELGYLLYFVADLPTTPAQSCIAVAQSRDLVTWNRSAPVLSRRHSTFEAFVCKTESPCVVERDGLYFLFYRHGNGTKFAASTTPLSWDGCDSYVLGPLHAAEVFEYRDAWYATSCSRPIHDIAHRQDRTDGLSLGSLEWNEGWPKLV